MSRDDDRNELSLDLAFRFTGWVDAGPGEVADAVLSSDWLRERLAAAWDEGLDAVADDWFDGDGGPIRNPYRTNT